MKTVHLACAILILLLVGCASNSRMLRVESEAFHPRTTEPEQLLLKTRGKAGQRFMGYVVVDGNRQELSGTSPAQFAIEGIVLIGEIRKLGGPGRLSFSLENVPKTRSVGFGGLERNQARCRFGYHDGAIESYLK